MEEIDWPPAEEAKKHNTLSAREDIDSKSIAVIAMQNGRKIDVKQGN